MRKIFKKALTLLLTGALTLSPSTISMAEESSVDANLSKTYKIMPFGDSITAGWCASMESEYQFGGYRIYLQRKLKENGYQKYTDFVGLYQSGPSELYDSDNTGRNGATIDDLQRNCDKNNVMSTCNPDIVMLQVGTNDIIYQSTTTESLLLSGAMERLEKLIDTVISGLPTDGVLFLATIPDMSGSESSKNSDVAKYNSIVRNLASKKVSEGKNVVLIDVHSLIKSDLFDDEYHPNQKGYEAMGNLWYDTLTAYFSDPVTFLAQEKAAMPEYKPMDNPFPVIPTPKLNDKFTVKGLTYKVTDTATKTVSLIKATSKIKKKSSITVPDTVTYLNTTLRVTALGKNVFKKSKAKKITLGKNVKQINKGALANCKKLKKLTIYSNFLTTVKKGAGSGTGKKSLKIYVPFIKQGVYKKLLKKGSFKKFKLKTN